MATEVWASIRVIYYNEKAWPKQKIGVVASLFQAGQTSKILHTVS